MEKGLMDRMDRKILYGRKVIAIENRFGQTLEEILTRMNQKGMSYRQQAKLLGVTGAQIGQYCKKMGLRPIRKSGLDDTTLLSIAGLKEKENENDKLL